jgi:hypothetical protein
LFFGFCPFEGTYGRVGAITIATGRLVLMCDECGTVWMHPDDVGTDRFHRPVGPDWAIGAGEAVAPSTTRWASKEEIDAAGWSVHLQHD